MFIKSRQLCTSIAAVFLFLGCGNAAAAGKAPAWLMTGGQHLPEADLPATAVRGSAITSGLNPAAFGAPGLRVPLANGRVLQATRLRVVDDVARGRQSWVGTFADQPGSLLVLSKARGVTTGFITYGVETFEIMPARGGRHMIYQLDSSKLPQSGEVLIADDLASDTGSTSDYGTGGTALDGGFVHDLLVVYTPASRTRYGQEVLESRIVAAVAAANQAYQNSGVHITLNLVGLQEIEHTEGASMSDSLNELRGTSDGEMDSVHMIRDQLGADLVSLVTEYPGPCGIAYLMRPEDVGFAAYAFSAVYSDCLSLHSLAHELGHNQGNMHDRASSAHGGAYDYSYGFRRCETDGTGFRTVMSYSCPGSIRTAHFSNPEVHFEGWPTGISYEADPANSADNARSMNKTAATVAAFRKAATSAPVAPSALAASVPAAETVRLAWADNSTDEAGFKVERSGNGADFAEVASLGGGATSFTDTGLEARMTYWYRVRAFNGFGHSAYSNSVLVTLPDVAPAQPADVAASDNGDGSASVSWTDASSNETGFEVRREAWDARRGIWKSGTTIGTVPAGVTGLADVTGNGTFRYLVRALGLDVPSGYAGPAQVSVTGATKGGGKGRTK